MNEELKFDLFFSNFKLGPVALKNRIVFLPHYTGLATMESLPSEREIFYYAERAKGGAGLIIAGNYAVSKSGQMHPTFIDASNKAVITNFSRTADLVHKHGAKIFGQITHAGPTKMAKPQPDLWSPSQVIEGSSGTHTIMIDRDEMNEVKNSFRKSAQNLSESNFDGVELKIGHDGILRAFISPYYNKRKDEYGGNLKNRLRFIVEVIEAVRSVLDSNKVLGIRLCMDEFEEDGYGLSYAIDVLNYLEQKEAIDYVSTDAGTTWVSFIMQIPPMSIPLGYAEYMSAEIKKKTNLPVIAFGRINDPVQAEQILQNGSADLIGMVRQLVCDPEMPNKSMKGDIDNIRKCIACLDGCGMQTTYNQPIRCIQSISVGFEKDYGIDTLKQSSAKKKIIIIGGGVAGMKAAEVAGKRGHNVVLFEKEEVLGGQINLVKKIPFRNEFSEIVRYLEFQLKNLKNIDIRLNVEAKEKDILNKSPDVVIVATGSTRFIPKELLSNEVLTSWDVINDSVDLKGKIVLYDKLAKAEGIGVAEYILDFYEDTFLEFYTPAYYAGMDIHFLNQDVVFRKIFNKKIEFFPYHELLRVDNKSVVFKHRYSQKIKTLRKYDHLVYIGDMKSNDKLYWNLKGKVKELYRIGDAKAPRMVELAMHGAENLARSI